MNHNIIHLFIYLNGFLQMTMLRRSWTGGNHHMEVKMAKFPHSPILYYACGSMYVTKTATSPVALFLPLFSCVHNEAWGCAEI